MVIWITDFQRPTVGKKSKKTCNKITFYFKYNFMFERLWLDPELCPQRGKEIDSLKPLPI